MQSLREETSGNSMCHKKYVRCIIKSFFCRVILSNLVTFSVGENPNGKFSYVNIFITDYEIEKNLKISFMTLVDGGWSLWSSWGDCNSTCGRGVKTRTRACVAPRPKRGGQNCTGDEIDEAVCVNLYPCSGEPCDIAHHDK